MKTPGQNKTPRRSSRAKPAPVSEHIEAVRLIQWRDHNARIIPELRLLFAIPNGGKRNIRVAQKLKAEGVRAGVSDYLLPVARQGFHGLFLELKRIGGRATKEQKDWAPDMSKQGYMAIFCEGADVAKAAVLDYLGDGK